MTLEMLAIISLVLAAIPCGLFLLNLAFYRRIGLGDSSRKVGEPISILIPARNEELNIRATLESVLANRDVNFEVIVLDDGSTDGTAAIVREFARRDERVRLERAPQLPAGWCGKQHACHVLAQHARHPMLVFVDADVRLAPDALQRMSGFLQRSDAALASGVPRQELGTLSERLLIPLIHFVLLGYLPMFMMRWTRRAAFSAGCGQLFIIRADAYHATGGHAGIRATLHDGVKLPRLFRRAGFKTDLFDATDIANCRMYQTNGETWRGLGKNATEGLAAPGVILPMTLFLLGGQVLPFVWLAAAFWIGMPGLWIALAACACALLPRLVAVQKFSQTLMSAWLHPLGILALLAIQWFALGKSLLGKPSEWKGRAYPVGMMKPTAAATRTLTGVLFAGFLSMTALAGNDTNKICRSFELRDQFDAVHRVAFPRTNVIVLTIADKQGNAQIDGWLAPLKEQGAGRVEILGIAAVDGVPKMLRDGVRKKFAHTRKHPVMLDWEGNVTAQFQPRKNLANLYVLDRSGRIAARFSGPVNPEALRELVRAIGEAQEPQPES